MRYFIITILIYVGISFSSYAQITASKTQGCTPLSVNFSSALNNVSTYHWDFGNGMYSTMEAPVALYEQAGSYSVGLTVEYDNGTSAVFGLNTPISVINKPTVDFNSVASEFCNSDPITFTNNTTGAINYLWDFGDGNTSSDSEPTHAYENAGNYSVTLIAYNEYGCPAVKIMDGTIKINEVAGLDFEANKRTACLDGAAISFSSSGAFASWLWDFGDGTQSTLANPNHSYSGFGEFDVSLEVKGANGCVGKLTKTNFIEVYPVPNVDIEVSEHIICTNGSISFTNQTPNTSSVLWTFNDGYSSGEYSFSRQFTAPGTYSYDVVVSDANGCSTTSTFSGEIQVIDANPPTVTISENEGCVPLQVLFKNETTNAIGAEWKIGELTFTDLNFEYTFQDPGTYPILVKTKHASGCTSTYEYDNPIIVYDADVDINVDNHSGCVPFEASFGLSNQNISQINWDFGNGITSNVLSPKVTYSKPGSYLVKASFINEFGCPDSAVLSKPMIAKDTLINIAPAEVIHACNNIEMFFAGEMGKDFWTWDFGDGTTSSMMSPSHIYDQPGTYTVSLTTNNHSGCKTTILDYNQIVVHEIDVDYNVTVTQGAECPDFTVQFENAFDYTELLWDFGDGTFSSEINPVHTYSSNSQISTKLTVTDSLGCSKNMTSIISSPWPYCTQDNDDDAPPMPPDSINIVRYHTLKSCTVPFEIKFNNPKPNANDWQWAFGDGTTSNEEHPSHTYTELGEYYVDLMYAESAGDMDTIVHYVTVIIKNALVDFDYAIEGNCGGAEVSFFNTDNTLVDWQWDFGNGTVSNVRDPKETYNNEAVFQVSLDAEDSAGCVGKTVKNIIIGNPYVQFEYPDNICLGDSIQIKHNIQFYDKYEWDFGDGNKSTNLYPMHLYTVAGEYQITMKAQGTNGCLKTFELPYLVTVNEPKADFTVLGKKHGCNNLTTTFKSLAGNVDKWYWDFGNGTTSEDENPTVNFEPGIFSVQLTVWKNGCSDTASYKDLIMVDEVTADFSYEMDKICLPITVQFAGQSLKADRWIWDFGDGTSSSEQNPVHVYNEYPKDNLVTLTIKTKNKCFLKIKKQLDPFFEPDFSANKNELCIPEEVQFTSNTQNAKDWNWDFGDGNHASGETVSHTYATAGEYSVKLVVQSVTGCYDTLAIDSMIAAMDVKAKFKANIADNSCAPLLVNFQNESSGATEYHWDFGDSSTSVGKNPIHVYSQVGNFDVKLVATNDYGCINEMVVNDLITTNGPRAYFSISDSVMCDPTQIEFTDLSKSAVKWEWFFGDGASSSEQNPQYQYPKPGNYLVSLLATDELGCSEIVKSDTIKVYPTPNAGFTIEAYDQCMPVSIEVHNTSGNLQNEQYAWNLGNGIVHEGELSQISYDEPGDYAVWLTVTNEGLCSNTFELEDKISVMDTVQILEPTVFELSVQDDESIRLINAPYLKNNFKYHVVYRTEDSEQPYEPVDTLWNAMDTFYVDSKVAPDFNSYAYQIKTTAYCQNEEQEAPASTYQSIKLVGEASEEGITIGWTPYIGHTFDEYVVYRKWNDNDWQKVGVLTPGQIDFVDTEDLCPGEYSYKIVARHLNSMEYYSNSNDINIKPFRNVFEDQKVDIIRSTVEGEAIYTEWKEPAIGPDKVISYRVWRSLDQQNYELIDQVPKGLTNFYDDNVDVANKAYYYMIDVINTCDVNGAESNLGSSILLQKETDQYINRIFWNPYKEWPDGVSRYQIQRKNEFGEWETIDTVPSSQKEYTIDLNKD